MAVFEEVLQAMKEKKRFSHEGWYDSQKILWDNQDKYLMLAPKLLLSDKWIIESDEDVKANKENS